MDLKVELIKTKCFVMKSHSLDHECFTGGLKQTWSTIEFKFVNRQLFKYVTKPHLFLWLVSVLNINPADEDLKRFKYIYSKWKKLLCFSGKISNEYIHQHYFFSIFYSKINYNNFMQGFVRIRLKCFQVFFIMSIAKLSLTKPERKS